VRDVLILCYHAVSERWPADLVVTPTDLERQLGLLAARGYRGATFHDAVHAPPAPRTLAVTFDDSYRSVLTLAAPILSRFDLPGTVFVPTGFAGGDSPMAWPGIDQWLGGPYETELLPMSWDELGSLAAAGWEIGSHTRTHPRLTEVEGVALAEELEGSRRECEAGSGRRCRSLAYPYGDVDDRVVEAARSAGYTAAGGLPGPVLWPPIALRWPRIGIYRPDILARFRLKVSTRFRSLRARRGFGAVAAGLRIVRQPTGG
jgi:peptidoglycan/xylan/chitin deacetylase (PgdA/CDA1 family)